MAGVALIVLLVNLTFDFDASARAHAACGAHLWGLRERYRVAALGPARRRAERCRCAASPRQADRRAQADLRHRVGDRARSRISRRRPARCRRKEPPADRTAAAGRTAAASRCARYDRPEEQRVFDMLSFRRSDGRTQGSPPRTHRRARPDEHDLFRAAVARLEAGHAAQARSLHPRQSAAQWTTSIRTSRIETRRLGIRDLGIGD